MLWLYCFDVSIDMVGRALVGVVDTDQGIASVIAKAAALRDYGEDENMVNDPDYPCPLSDTAVNPYWQCQVAESTRPGISFVYRDR